MYPSGFTWDPEKNARNLALHGVDFWLAAELFQGPVMEAIDARKDYGEERRVAVGQAGGRILVVVFTWRGEQRRLISAWLAKVSVREAYAARFPA